MGIVQVEQLKLRQQEIEVRALVALTKSKTKGFVIEAEHRLREIAYPNKVANLYDIKKDRKIEEYE